MANWGAKDKNLALLLFLLYLCIVFRIASTRVVHDMCKKMRKKRRSGKKITIYLHMSNICCNFAPTSQRRRRQSPSVVKRRHIFTNNTNWIRRNLANFMNHKDWHLLVHVSCTTFVVFVIRAMREPLRRYNRSSTFLCVLMRTI